MKDPHDTQTQELPLVKTEPAPFSLDDDTPLACPVDKVDGQPCESCQ